MTVARYERSIQDTLGNLITTPGFQFEVRREDVAGSPKGVLYSDRAGSVPLSNPAPLVSGVVAFHAVGGSYSVRVYGTGYDQTFRYQALGTGAETDSDELLIPGYLFEWEAGTTAPPGAGGIRANNAAMGSATRLYVWKSSIAGSDVASRIAALLNKRVLITSTNAGEQTSWQVDLVTDQTTYYELNISAFVGATAIPAGRVGLQREGEVGAAGADGKLSGTKVSLSTPSETIVNSHDGKTIELKSASPMALAVDAVANLSASFMCIITNVAAGTATLDPNGSETVDGLASITIQQNESLLLFRDGTVLRTALGGYQRGGRDVPLADGGTGSSLADPAADRIMFWDDSADKVDWLSLSGLAISGTVLGIDPATQSDMETGTDVTKPVTAGRAHFHPSSVKNWGMTTGGGSPTLSASYNTTSITDAGTGLLTVTIGNDFSSANYAAVASASKANTSQTFIAAIITPAAGSFQIDIKSDSNGGVDPPTGWHWAAMGDL